MLIARRPARSAAPAGEHLASTVVNAATLYARRGIAGIRAWLTGKAGSPATVATPGPTISESDNKLK
jgi:hypothetical protein